MQKLLTFFQQKFQHICVSVDVNFNESLTNNIVSFEQLGPDRFWKGIHSRMEVSASLGAFSFNLERTPPTHPPKLTSPHHYPPFQIGGQNNLPRTVSNESVPTALKSE